MHYCSRCGKILEETDMYCPQCGFAVDKDSAEFNRVHQGLWTLLGCCIPVAGLVVYLAYRDDKPHTAEAAKNGIICCIVAYILLFVLTFLLGLVVALL